MVKRVKGAMSGVMKTVLHKFFSVSGPNFSTTGALLLCGNDTIVFKAAFAGFLGDEKGLKEIFASKGYGSSRPCLGCKNLIQFIDSTVLEADDYLVGIGCANPARFDRASDREIYEAVDMLTAAAAHQSRSDLELLEQTLGLHHEPHGILFDAHCRSLVGPVNGYLRDWMHMLSVSGIANIEIEQVVHSLGSVGVRPQMLTDFFAQFRLPRSAGKVDPDWWTTKRLGRPSEVKDGWKGFSGEVLTVVPILLYFLETAVAPMGVLADHIRCFRLLDRIIKLFGLGAERAVQHIDAIERALADHAALYAALYADVIKPKYHYIFHVMDHMRQTGRLLSCFVTERKHRTSKAIANHVFRNFEKTLAIDLVTLMYDRVFNRPELFEPEHLVSAKQVTSGGVQATAAPSAMLLCGSVSKEDIIMMSDKTVGIVDGFYAITNEIDASIVCVVRPLDHVASNRWRASNRPAVAVPSADVLEALAWYPAGGDKCVLPPRASVIW